MLISVIIPCFNQAEFLGEAIESALAQSMENLEVIVINDGSTDNTLEVAERIPEIICITQENRGLARARNRGFHASHGDYIVFLDSDDQLGPNALQAGLESLLSAPDAVFTFGAMQTIGIDGSKLALRRPHITSNHFQDLLANNFIPTPGMAIFRRTALDKYGVFDPAVSGSDDYDIYLRMTRRELVTSHSEVAVLRRFHANNMTGNPGLMLYTVLKAQKRRWHEAKSNPEHRTAYKKGRQFWKKWYGGQVLTVLRINLSQRNWRQAMRNFTLLARYRGRELWQLLTQAAKSNSLTLKIVADKFSEEYKTDFQTERTVKTSRLIGITINSLSPEQIEMDDLPPVIRNKFVLLTVACVGANKCAQIFVDHLPIDTIWANNKQLVGCFPINLLERPGNYEIYVIS
jgi:glycosyltransferase involved in cell wall biosynthesis